MLQRNLSMRTNSTERCTRVVRVAILAGAGLLLVALSACQTVKGLGNDIHYAGEKTEQAIQGK